MATEFRESPEETGDQLAVVRGTVPPGAIVPLHSRTDPEIFYLLEGSLEAYRENRGWTTTSPQGVIVIPPHAKHALRNSSTNLVVALTVMQKELYQFFREVAKPVESGTLPTPPSPEDFKRLFAAAERYHYWSASPAENEAIGIHLGAGVS